MRKVGKVCTYREKVSGEVAASVDAAVHVNESLHCDLFLHVGVVQDCVKHNNGHRQHVTRVYNDMPTYSHVYQQL